MEIRKEPRGYSAKVHGQEGYFQTLEGACKFLVDEGVKGQTIPELIASIKQVRVDILAALEALR